jgi:hypothetical protein
MIPTSLLWLAMLSMAWQAAAPLALDVRVFRGSIDVTRETNVTVFPSGARTNGQPAPLVATGARQLSFPPGRYDLQLIQHQDGKVSGIAWTTLRLLAAYPGEDGPHLEVLNFDTSWGALQIREAATQPSGSGRWSARLLRKDGSEVARGVAGDDYQVLVAPAGTYDLAIARPSSPTLVRNVEVMANLTQVHRF